VTDPDVGDSVYFYLNNAGITNNGPFAVSPGPAIFTPPVSNFPLKGFSPQSGYFQWDVLCDHIKTGFYQVDFYAHDNINKNPPLAANHITKIRVVPGPVENLTVVPGSRKFFLNWSAHTCANATGYEVYRAAAPAGSVSDSLCCTNPIVSGYTRIATLDGWNNTSYVDSVQTFQNQYCYRIVTLFGGVRSCPSNEVCLPIKQDFPLVTQDSVGITDLANGTILVSWANPTELDTQFYPKPYTYQLKRGEGQNPTSFANIATLPYETTEFLDTNLNTTEKSWSYMLDLFDANQVKITYSNQASSVFLSITSADQVLDLNWTYQVPWIQDSVQIFRSDTLNGTYVYIATVPGNVKHYKDSGLDNGNDYCYFVRTFGHYESTGLERPLINDSQKTCAIPVDLTPPCVPSKESILVNANCDNFQILFTWQVPDSACGGDIDFYSVLMSEQSGGPYQPIHQTSSRTDTTYIFSGNSIKGCFVLTATDTVGNVSPYSAEFCTDNCPYIIFPNVFTPNGDGINDFFNPIEYRSIESINIWIYDRWGVLIHQNKGLTNLWDGKKKGKELTEGVYFYQAEITLDTLDKKVVKRTGNISLLR
jgi:gliding motility-associated-like protein